MPARETNKSDLLSRVFGQLRDLGLADKIAEYERYVQQKYGAGMKDLPAESLQEQVVNLERCKEDYELSERFRSYLNRLQAA